MKWGFSLLCGFSMILVLTLNNSCDPEATGIVNPAAVASSEEYATFANVYASGFSVFSPIITSMNYLAAELTRYQNKDSCC